MVKTKRSRSFRRVFVKTPKGSSKLSYKARKPKKAVCASCGKQLHGIKKDRPYKINKLTKSKRRPERVFGGNLCSSCSKRKLIKDSRGK